MKINRTNTILYCKLWADTVTFYRNVLGLPISFSNEWFVEFEVTENARLSVADENRASIKSSQGNGITLSFNVENLTDLHTSLTEQGVAVTPTKELWSAQVFYIHDPEGNRIEFWAASTTESPNPA